MAKKEKKPLVILQRAEHGVSEIHVEGSVLPNLVYLEILSAIKELGIHSRKIIVVKTPAMMRLIRECIPREYYENIVLMVNYNGEEIRQYAG